MKDRQWFVLYVLISVEVGIFLILAPWSAIWERNYFLQLHPMLAGVVLDPMFRGAVSGLGAANIYIGLNEIFRRRARLATQPALFPDGLTFADRRDLEPIRNAQGGDAGTGGSEPEAVTTQEKHS